MDYEEWWREYGSALNPKEIPWGSPVLLLSLWLLLLEARLPVLCEFCENGWPRRLRAGRLWITVEVVNCVVGLTHMSGDVMVCDEVMVFELADPGSGEAVVEYVRGNYDWLG